MTRPDTGVLSLPVRRAPEWVDAVLAVLAAVLAVAVLVSADVAAIDPALRPASPIAVVLTAVGAAGTGLRRRRPLLGLAMVAVAAFVVSGGSYFTGVLPYLTMLALYAVAAHGTRREAVVGLLLVVVAFVALQRAGVPDLAVIDVATSAAICVAVVAIGDAVRQRRAHQRDLLAAAGARAEVASRQAVVEERLRIARDLHDVVAHSMSLIAVQAGVGAHLLRGDPDAAARALEVIAETSRRALAQTRSVVGLLRGGDDAQSPVPGLVSLETLVQGVREAGLSVDVRVDGTAHELPALVDLAAYRVVQEDPHQRGETRARPSGDGADQLRTDGPAGGGRGHRHRRTGRGDAGRAGLRAAGAAGAGPGRRGQPDGRSHRRRRVPGPCRPAHRRGPAMIRVAVVDDQELVRSAFVLLLQSHPGLEVVGQAGDGRAAVALARSARPDVVLMDVRMPGLDGLEATRRIVADERCRGTRVLMLTTYDDDDLVHAALRAGASGFLLKDVRPQHLLDAIEVVAGGEALLAPTVTRRLIELFATLPALRPVHASVTDRERDLLRAVARGLANQEIAEALNLGYGTVKTHVSSLLLKLGCRDRAQLVMYAYETGLAVPGTPGGSDPSPVRGS
ncbi:helix-turn-helix transcriptional regulator [Virgisporangium aurantiacum]|uniref:DNA-binding response regulator, NarL/FixJ family, contains REC and HTH domains n=2 Tax=Virgisporangium aurantiacum TaxID=175570 RepID=A0A8J3Z3Z2_9ACTN|nr:response regulator transcription factor family protein [Virgisporangium aurantiacum]GIJ57169.1 hypothetical protein Vau01_046850 [Virgisporangium aurantiacum]